MFHPRMPVAKMHGLFGAAWWVPNKACFRRWVEAAGFDVIRTGGVSFVERHGAKPSVRTLMRHPVTTATPRLAGLSQSWVLSRPGK
jgi:hypothetical protein